MLQMDAQKEWGSLIFSWGGMFDIDGVVAPALAEDSDEYEVSDSDSYDNGSASDWYIVGGEAANSEDCDDDGFSEDEELPSRIVEDTKTIGQQPVDGMSCAVIQIPRMPRCQDDAECATNGLSPAEDVTKDSGIEKQDSNQQSYGGANNSRLCASKFFGSYCWYYVI